MEKVKYKLYNISTLRRHQKSVHDKIKSFECQLCQKKFGLSAYLRKHITTVHQKIKNFECHICRNSFADRGNPVKTSKK